MSAANEEDTRTDLPFEAGRQMDLLCDDFERAWQDGRPRPIEEYLRSADTGWAAALRVELLRMELEWRARGGDRPQVEDYARRFPDLAAALSGWLREAEAAAERLSPAATPRAAASSTPGRAPAAETPHGPAAGSAASAPAPLPQVLGEYEVLDSLGSGGMGKVYRARHRRLGKVVALKVMKPSLLTSPEALARFRREMAAVGPLDHPHLVEAYDAGEQDGIVYLILKLIDGVDLQQLVRQRGPLPVAEACELVRQAALGLQHLHERGLIHRDVKPSNLMRTPSGTVKVLDLGLARLRSPKAPGELTSPDSPMGTPDYLAPEQIDNPATVDVRADLYSLGATLFYLLTGQPPFAHHSELLAKLKAHGFEPPRHVRALRPDVPEGVAALVARLLAKRPEERFATSQELADALASFTTPSMRPGEIDGAGLPAAGEHLDAALSPNSVRLPAKPSAQRPRRRKLLYAALGMLMLAPAIGAVLALSRRLPSSTVPATAPGERSIPPVSAGAWKGSLDVVLWNQQDRARRSLRLNDPGTLPLRPGDEIAVEARLNRPAYLYVLWIDTDGRVQPVYPWRPGHWEDRPSQEAPLDRLRRPEALDEFFAVEPGTAGMQTLVLLARQTPLPSAVDLRAELGPLPRQTEQDLRAAVWFENGVAVQDETGRRALRFDVKKVEDPVLVAQQRLRELQRRCGFALTRAVSFADRGR